MDTLIETGRVHAMPPAERCYADPLGDIMPTRGRCLTGALSGAQIRDAREMLNERRSLPTKDSSRDAGIKAAQPEPAKAAPTKAVNPSPTPLMPSHVSQRRQQGQCQGHPA